MRMRKFRAAWFVVPMLMGLMAATSSFAADLPPHWQRSYDDLNGKPQVLDQWRGKVVAVNFWATWCAPCLHEMPALNRFQKDHDDRIQLIGVGMDKLDKVKNVVRTLGISYPMLVTDPKQDLELLADWGNRSGMVPYTVFFDRQGIIRILHKGPLDEATLSAYLTELETKPAD